MSRGKTVVAISVVIFLGAGLTGSIISGGSHGFVLRGASSFSTTESMSPSTSASSVGSPRDTQSGVGPGPGLGTTGGIGGTIGTPRDTDPSGGTTGGTGGVNAQ